jgi:hypothetical protein
MKKCALLLALTLVSAAPLAAQLVTVGTGTITNTTTGYPAPYGNYWWGSRHQFIIQASELTGLGVATGATLNSVAFDVATVNGQALANFEIKVGLTTAANLSGGWITGTAAGLSPLATYQPVVGWNTHLLSVPLNWDGVSNLVIETCHQNASYTLNCSHRQSATTFTSSRWYRADAAGVCANPATTGTALQRPNMQLSFAGAALPPEYQVNQAQSSLDFNGVNNTAFTANVANACAGSTVNTNLATNLVGSGWDIALSFLPIVPASAGGITLPDGQVVNLNLAGGLIWLNGGAGPMLLPMPGVFTIPFAAPPAPFAISAQQIVVDPTTSSFIRFSQAAQLNAINFGSQPLVMGDDTNTLIALGGAPLCTPASLNFYGTAYTQINMLSNGRMMFGLANNSFTPTAAAVTTSAGSFGVWTDFNPATGGTVTVSGLAVGGIRLDFAGVNFFGTTIPNTFGMQLDSAGVAQIDGLAGLATNTLQQWIGISGGLATTAVAGAPVAFSPASGLPVTGPATPADVIFNIGTAGSMTTGLSSIVFMPNAGGNYDWMSL